MKSKSVIKRKRVQNGLPPLSDIWTMECSDCEGSGGIIKARTNRGELILHPLNRCSHCKGKGGFNLGVGYEIIWQESYKQYQCSNRSCGKLSNDKITCCHRPLDREEVEDMAHRVTDEIRPTLAEGVEYIVNLAREGKLIQSHTGKHIKLMPKEG